MIIRTRTNADLLFDINIVTHGLGQIRIGFCNHYGHSKANGHGAWLWNILGYFLLWFDRARDLTASLDWPSGCGLIVYGKKILRLGCLYCWLIKRTFDPKTLGKSWKNCQDANLCIVWLTEWLVNVIIG